MPDKIAFSGGAFDPPHLAHLAIARQILSEGRADIVHIGPSGVRPDKAYHVSNTHRRRMIEILAEEQHDLTPDLLVADFDFIDAPREKSATHGVHNWFKDNLGMVPRQIFGTDVIPNIDRFWMHSEWVKREALKLFVPRGGEKVDYSGLQNYEVMPFCASGYLMQLSSSQVRELIPQGDFSGLSDGVAEYIQRHGLYLPTASRSIVSMHISTPLQKLPYSKARHEKPESYPDRFSVPDDKVLWNEIFTEYAPSDFTHDEVLQQFNTKGAQGWADGPDIPSDPDAVFHSYEGIIQRDEHGRPMNPHGRTGISGRGLLGKWGANFAADPLVTRNNPNTGELELLVIKRGDTGEWAIPGGMVDFGEFCSAAAGRELKEEAGLDMDFSRAPIVYQGYVDDPRNTDNAWMETAAVHVHLTDEQARDMEPEAGDDATDFGWILLVDEKINTLYASHGELVRAMMKKLDSPEIQKLRAHIVTAPDPVPESPLPKIFLAGSIENDTAVNWQQQLLTDLSETPCLIINPRRKVWDPTWSQDSNPALVEQIKWELDGIEQSDLVCFYFDPNTRSPITLLELGLCRNKENVHVCCPPGFWRRDNVLVTAKHLGYTIHEDIATITDVIREFSSHLEPK